MRGTAPVQRQIPGRYRGNPCRAGCDSATGTRDWGAVFAAIPFHPRAHATTTISAGLALLLTFSRPVNAQQLRVSSRAPSGDWSMVPKIREEGLQRSRVMEFEGYIADVLGARLTLSSDMKRAQSCVQSEMTRTGLVNVAAEPFMDFGVT